MWQKLQLKLTLDAVLRQSSSNFLVSVTHRSGSHCFMKSSVESDIFNKVTHSLNKVWSKTDSQLNLGDIRKNRH